MKMPAGTPEYERLLRESDVLIKRLNTGREMLADAYKQSSIVQAFKIIEVYGQVSKELMNKFEEMALIHQFYATGQKNYLRRDGMQIHVDRFVSGEDIEMDAHTLLALRELKNVFGEIPHDILHIKD